MNTEPLLISFAAQVIRFLTGVPQYRIPLDGARKPRIYFANHSSHLDAATIWAALPASERRRLHPVAARDYWQKNFIRRFLSSYIFSAILVDRMARGREKIENEFELMSRVLEKNECLIIFPEGTRGEGHEIQKFKSGLFELAKRHPEADLIPTSLENLNRILPKGKFLLVPLICRLNFGSPLVRLENEERKDFLKRARLELEKLQNG